MTNSSKEDLLILLGAGASVHAGMPAVSDITERLVMCSEWDSPWVNDVELVYNGFRTEPDLSHCFHQVRSYSRQHSNYEQFLGYLEKASQSASRGSVQPIQVHTITVNTIIDAFRVKPKLSKCGKENYNVLFDKYRVLIFTLNYDSVAEDYANQLNIPISDGFSSNQSDGVAQFDPRELKSDMVSKKHILAHLHGSIFYSMPDSQTISKYRTLTATATARLGLDGTRGEQKLKSGTGANQFFASTIISGTGKENAVNNMPVMKTYMSELKKLCQNVKRILIIGYGGNDPHINDQLSTAYKNPELRISYVTMSPFDYVPREVLSALPGARFWTVDGNDGWKSEDGKVLVKTSGFPLDEFSMRHILSHLERS